MVKNNQPTEKELIEEDERLEKIFREKIRKQRNFQLNREQFQNRVLDLFHSIYKSGIASPNCFSLILKRTPNVLNKLCISTRHSSVNGQKIIQTLNTAIGAQHAVLENHLEAIDLLVKTVFNIYIYKKPKDIASDLLNIVLILLKSKKKKVEQLIEQNLGILIGFLDKGKDIEKVFFGFRKVLAHSFFCLYSRFEELLAILSQTKNLLFVEQFLKFLFEAFHSKIIVENSKSPNQTQKVTLQNFATMFEKECLNILLNINNRDNKGGQEESKRTAKCKKYLKMLVEYLSKYSGKKGHSNFDKTQALIKIEKKEKN